MKLLVYVPERQKRQLVWLWMTRRRLSPQLLEVVRGWFHLVPHTKEQLRPAAHLAARARAVVMEGGTHTLRWTLGCIENGIFVQKCHFQTLNCARGNS